MFYSKIMDEVEDVVLEPATESNTTEETTTATEEIAGVPVEEKANVEDKTEDCNKKCDELKDKLKQALTSYHTEYDKVSKVCNALTGKGLLTTQNLLHKGDEIVKPIEMPGYEVTDETLELVKCLTGELKAYNMVYSGEVTEATESLLQSENCQMKYNDAIAAMYTGDNIIIEKTLYDLETIFAAEALGVLIEADIDEDSLKTCASIILDTNFNGLVTEACEALSNISKAYLIACESITTSSNEESDFLGLPDDYELYVKDACESVFTNIMINYAEEGIFKSVGKIFTGNQSRQNQKELGRSLKTGGEEDRDSFREDIDYYIEKIKKLTEPNRKKYEEYNNSKLGLKTPLFNIHEKLVTGEKAINKLTKLKNKIDDDMTTIEANNILSAAKAIYETQKNSINLFAGQLDKAFSDTTKAQSIKANFPGIKETIYETIQKKADALSEKMDKAYLDVGSPVLTTAAKVATTGAANVAKGVSIRAHDKQQLEAQERAKIRNAGGKKYVYTDEKEKAERLRKEQLERAAKLKAEREEEERLEAKKKEAEERANAKAEKSNTEAIKNTATEVKKTSKRTTTTSTKAPVTTEPPVEATNAPKTSKKTTKTAEPVKDDVAEDLKPASVTKARATKTPKPVDPVAAKVNDKDTRKEAKASVKAQIEAAKERLRLEEEAKAKKAAAKKAAEEKKNAEETAAPAKESLESILEAMNIDIDDYDYETALEAFGKDKAARLKQNRDTNAPIIERKVNEVGKMLANVKNLKSKVTKAIDLLMATDATKFNVHTNMLKKKYSSKLEYDKATASRYITAMQANFDDLKAMANDYDFLIGKTDKVISASDKIVTSATKNNTKAIAVMNSVLASLQTNSKVAKNIDKSYVDAEREVDEARKENKKHPKYGAITQANVTINKLDKRSNTRYSRSDLADAYKGLMAEYGVESLFEVTTLDNEAVYIALECYYNTLFAEDEAFNNAVEDMYSYAIESQIVNAIFQENAEAFEEAFGDIYDELAEEGVFNDLHSSVINYANQIKTGLDDTNITLAISMLFDKIIAVLEAMVIAIKKDGISAEMGEYLRKVMATMNKYIDGITKSKIDFIAKNPSMLKEMNRVISDTRIALANIGEEPQKDAKGIYDKFRKQDEVEVMSKNDMTKFLTEVKQFVSSLKSTRKLFESYLKYENIDQKTTAVISNMTLLLHKYCATVMQYVQSATVHTKRPLIRTLPVEIDPAMVKFVAPM